MQNNYTYFLYHEFKHNIYIYIILFKIDTGNRDKDNIIFLFLQHHPPHSTQPKSPHKEHYIICVSFLRGGLVKLGGVGGGGMCL